MHYWTFYELLDNILQFFNVVLVGWALIYAVRQYRSSQEEKLEKERPFVYLDLEFDSHLCTLVIKSMGGSPAKDVRVRFKPKIVLHNENINALPIFNGLPFLAPDKEIKMFLGSMLGDNSIKKRYEVNIKYRDLHGKEYDETQIIDPSKYIGISSIVRKGTHEIAKSLEKIEKSSDRSHRELEMLNKILKQGINIRNRELHLYSSKELLSLIKNTYEKTDKNRLELFPELYDVQLLLKHTKEKLLSKSLLSKKERKIVELIDSIIGYPFFSGYGNEYQQKWEALLKELS